MPTENAFHGVGIPRGSSQCGGKLFPMVDYFFFSKNLLVEHVWQWHPLANIGTAGCLHLKEPHATNGDRPLGCVERLMGPLSFA